MIAEASTTPRTTDDNRRQFDKLLLTTSCHAETILMMILDIYLASNCVMKPPCCKGGDRRDSACSKSVVQGVVALLAAPGCHPRAKGLAHRAFGQLWLSTSAHERLAPSAFRSCGVSRARFFTPRLGSKRHGS